MTDSSYNIRNYRPADFDKYVQLHIEAGKLEATQRYPSPQTLRENLNRPNYSPQQDLFIVETADNIVGCLDVTPERNAGWVILNCRVHPEHRRRGLATKLLGYAMTRAKELGAKAARVNIPQDNLAAKSALSRSGFRYVRRFLQMRLDLSELHGQETAQPARHYRHLKRGEENQLTEIQNRSFADTWEYNPNTVEEIIYRVNSSRSSPEDVVLTYEGDKAIGYCWTGITNETVESERKGQIFMLGVDPEYRGQGIGEGVLRAGLAHLKSKGFHVVELTVDDRNKAAYTLYRSIGFKVQESSLWYEKAVD